MSNTCNHMNWSTPGFPVLHCLPWFRQTHIHWVDDAIQPSHPLLSPPSTPFLSIFPSITVFSNESVFCISWPKYWSFSISPSNEYSGLLSFRIDWFWSPCSPKDPQESSSTPQFKSINPSVLRLLYGPTLTSMHDYWKNHSFDYADLCWQSNVSAF